MIPTYVKAMAVIAVIAVAVFFAVLMVQSRNEKK